MKNNQNNTSAASAGRMSKKTVALLLAFTLLLGTAIGGAVAYLMDTTEPVVNTFTYGNIDIDLTETEGGNNHEFKMMPGITIAKDPVVTVKAGSEDNWLYVKLDESENFDAFMTYTMADGWTQLEGYDNIWYREFDAKDAESADKTYSVLKDNQVQVKSTVTKEMFDGLEDAPLPTLTVTAYAVQRDENQSALKTAVQAWLAIPTQASTAEDVQNAVADTNNTDAATTITLADDIQGGSGLVLTANGTDSNLTMDFNGNTYTVTNAVGSAGTKSQAAHFEKGSTVLLKDGTLTKVGNDVKMLVQNYADMTIDNMKLDGADADYVLSCNYGNTLITGNTDITAASGKVAIDVMHWVGSYDEGVTVTIDEHMTGTVDGKICVYRYENEQEYYENCPLAKLIIKGGTFKNTGLTLEQFSAFVASGYKAVETETGVYKVEKAN